MTKTEIKRYQALEHIISMGALKVGTIIFVILLVILAIIMEIRGVI